MEAQSNDYKDVILSTKVTGNKLKYPYVEQIEILSG